MKYKAIIFDLDGTVVPSFAEGMPSKKVIEVANKVIGKVKLSSASARAAIFCRNIWKALSLEDPCIINGGSQIIDPKTEEIIWEQRLPEDSIIQIINKSKKHTDKLGINGLFLNIKTDLDKFPKNANIAVALGVKKEESQELVQELSKIPDVSVHILHSWIEGEYWDIHVTHKLATKKHAIEKLIEILGVKKEEVVGIGDGNNDLPLFESVGYKVAMGNAVDNLKMQADYITDTLDKDGFSKFLEEKVFKA